jgi:hypothetical protein
VTAARHRRVHSPVWVRVMDVATLRIDRPQARLVADALLDAPRHMAGPHVQAAYRDLALQADRLYARITDPTGPRPIRVVATACPEPYATGAELAARVRDERLLEIFPAHLERDRRHPLLDGSLGGGFDRFRAVHDIVSHAWWGLGFDRHGEFAAWCVEDRLYTGPARWALATELHAAHSVRWTTGNVADLKATLLPPSLIRASRRRAAAAQGI